MNELDRLNRQLAPIERALSLLSWWERRIKRQVFLSMDDEAASAAALGLSVPTLRREVSNHCGRILRGHMSEHDKEINQNRKGWFDKETKKIYISLSVFPRDILERAVRSVQENMRKAGFRSLRPGQASEWLNVAFSIGLKTEKEPAELSIRWSDEPHRCERFVRWEA
ncbi:hypothetical protein SAMN04487895_10330 [Paenibacillus sophorae]|uniref:Uncharacterized protein n=1 Tax=Paenibacillus sophorae TaxID=1333845 RepID=A0A1H8JHR3_9BACL|nr:hypothetical protein [Paenibacillus sophorae]QWU13368.1 hypothetical protein KP014_15305 [Paenibacillus sophorae]SEN80289.1 hypothetical protein SAMN04487895_10330 [Paenibacillus sophorae]